MAYYFDNVRLLAYRHTPVFFDAGLRYRVEKQLNIKATLMDVTNSDGVSIIIGKENQVISNSDDYQEIFLNGISFGRGRVNQIEFEGGVLVRSEDVTFDIVCYEDGNLFNALAGVYQDLTWADARRIESLEEDFEYQDNNGDREYTHSINVQFTEYTTSAQGVALAKALATTFFNAVSGLSTFLGNYAGASGAKKVYTESYDLIDCSASFTESVTIPATRSGNYSYSLNYDVQLGDDGFIEVSEEVGIYGLTQNRYAGAREGMSALSAGAYTRSSAVYAAYAFSDATLFAQPISKSISINKFTGEISIRTLFSNNPRYQNLAVWDYRLEISRDNDGYYTATESGTVLGYGRPFISKYQSAKSFYDATVAPNIATRVQDFYQNNSGRTLPLMLIEQSLDKNELEGSIGYSHTFTDNNLYQGGAIKKLQIEATIANPVHLVQKYDLFNNNQIAQTQLQSTLGNKSMRIEMKGKRGTAVSVYLTEAKAVATANQPANPDKFIESCEYSFYPETNAFSLAISWVFVGAYKSRDSLTID